MTFNEGLWNEQINVTDFVSRNITPYEGDASFLVGPTERTKRVWNVCLQALEEERANGGVRSIVNSRGYKYVLMNIPTDLVDAAVELLPAMRSPTILPLAAEGWCSMHVVIPEDVLWEKVESLKQLGAEGILVLNLENMIP